MEMVLIKPESQEWNYMWDWLAQHPINEGIEHPSIALNMEYGEAWQYMGSFKQDNRIIHEFRHRAHPTDNQRHYIKFKASENITDDDIEKTLTMK